MDDYYDPYNQFSFAEPLVETYPDSIDVEDTGEDVLSSIGIDPVTDQASTYNDELVERLVNQNAHAGPWVAISSQYTGSSPTAPVAPVLPAQQPGPGSAQLAPSTDSGYASHIYAPLICSVCSKRSRNRAEEKKHFSTHSRPYKCKVADCANEKGFATPNDLERHQKDIHFIQPKHGPRNYYKCALPTCSKKDKMWSRKDNFKAHILRMHKGMQIDVDRLIASSEFVPDSTDIESLARNRNATSHRTLPNRTKAKKREDRSDTETSPAVPTTTEQCVSTEVLSTQVPYLVWQSGILYPSVAPWEAADMVPTQVDSGNTEPDGYYTDERSYLTGSEMAQYGYNAEWDLCSETSYVLSHEGSSNFGGGIGEYG